MKKWLIFLVSAIYLLFGVHPPHAFASDPFAGCGKDINTAFGCIPTDTSGFITKIISISVGIVGGIAFLLILFGGFQILTSSGNPEKLNAGKELISSAIAGLLLVIFSVFILRFIGVSILGIPGFL